MLQNLSHCEGCDDQQPFVRTFVAKFRGEKEPQVVRYCVECAALARADFNGESEWIAETASVPAPAGAPF